VFRVGRTIASFSSTKNKALPVDSEMYGAARVMHVRDIFMCLVITVYEFCINGACLCRCGCWLPVVLRSSNDRNVK
jgi:hypothetical protein